MGKYYYVASARRRVGAWAPTGEERAGHNVSPRAQLVIVVTFIRVYKRPYTVYNLTMSEILLKIKDYW